MSIGNLPLSWRSGKVVILLTSSTASYLSMSNDPTDLSPLEHGVLSKVPNDWGLSEAEHVR